MRRKEKGYGLLSLAVAVAIAAIIAAGAGMTSLQVIRGTERNEDHARVTQQACSLGRWFTRDALTVKNITVGDDPETVDDEEFLTIYWKDWESGDTYDIRYLWFDDVDSLKLIKRNQIMRDKDGAVIKNTTSLIADSIYSANLSQQDSTWILNLETRSGQQSSMQEYRITQRLN
jgi:type II secretory pathway pseudopilin PulG